MSNAILVRGHMRFCENDNNDLLNRYANKIYSQNTFNGYTPLELSKNALEMYNNIVALFENLKPCQYNAPAIYKNISLRNKKKEYMCCALKELVILGQICGISLKEIMEESIRV